MLEKCIGALHIRRIYTCMPNYETKYIPSYVGIYYLHIYKYNMSLLQKRINCDLKHTVYDYPSSYVKLILINSLIISDELMVNYRNMVQGCVPPPTCRYPHPPPPATRRFFIPYKLSSARNISLCKVEAACTIFCKSK